MATAPRTEANAAMDTERWAFWEETWWQQPSSSAASSSSCPLGLTPSSSFGSGLSPFGATPSTTFGSTPASLDATPASALGSTPASSFGQTPASSASSFWVTPSALFAAMSASPTAATATPASAAGIITPQPSRLFEGLSPNEGKLLKELAWPQTPRLPAPVLPVGSVGPEHHYPANSPVRQRTQLVASASPRTPAVRKASLAGLGGADCGAGAAQSVTWGFLEMDEEAEVCERSNSKMSAAAAAAAATPNKKCKTASLFTPPPAPSVEMQRRELEDDVRSALAWKSVPLLAFTLHRGRGCGCSVDHSLHEAVNRQQLSALKFLLERGAKEGIDETCCGFRPLHRAVRMTRDKGDIGYEMMRTLLEHDADPNMAGNAPLLEAAIAACPAAIELLLEHGADPNAVGAGGRTALHLLSKKALFFPDTLLDQAAETLLRFGADPTLRDSAGKLASEHASETVMPFSGCHARALRLRLARAERWWARRGALFARAKGDRRHVLCRVPEDVFKAIVRFL